MSIADLREDITEILVNLKGIQENLPWNDYPMNSNWTKAQIIHHMADAVLNHFYRSKLILTLENPIFIDIDLEKWIELPDANRTHGSMSKLILIGLFSKWLTILEDLQEKDIQRTGIHEKFGEVSLETILNLGINHTKSHLKTLLS